MSYFEVTIANCRKCEGAAYQTFPVPHASSFGNKKILIAQNPGEIKASDAPRFEIFRAATKALADSRYDNVSQAAFVVSAYAQDFQTSSAYKIIEKVLGEEWTDHWTFTNSVRCRTPKNATPSLEMISNCAGYTNTLLSGKDVVVMMGSVARKQVSSLVNREFEINKIYVNNRTSVAYLAIPHFAAWPYKTKEELKIMREKLYDIQKIGESRAELP